MNAIPNRAAFEIARLTEAVREAQHEAQDKRAAFLASRGNAKASARRAMKHADRRLARAEQELKAEERGEQAAPAIQRQGIAVESYIGENGEVLVEPRDLVLRDPRILTTGKRTQLISALDHLASRGSITPEEHACGKAYRHAWERAGMDAYPIGLGEAGGSAPSSGNRRIEEAVGSSAELSRMRNALGTLATNLVEHVVVHELHYESWGVERCINRHQVIGMLKLALARVGEVRA